MAMGAGSDPGIDPGIDPGRVAAYIRWSTDEQAQGTTLEVQRAACAHYMRAQGWRFNPDLVFVDDGYSGGDLQRPALARLRRAVRAGAVQCVVVYTLDRLSRSVADTVDLVLKEWEGRCTVRCVQQPIDTGHPSGKMFFYLLASYAEFERDMIRARTLSGKLRRARQGANAGWRYNYGYARGAAPGTYCIHPDQATVVRGLFSGYLAGRGFGDLAGELNGRGVPSPTGKQWSANSVRAILSNPIYMGRLEYGREQRLQRDGRTIYLRSPAPRHAVVEAAVPPLVDRGTWEQVQRRRRERAAAARRTLAQRSYLLSGVARCGGCGRLLAGVASHNAPYYRCSGRKALGKAFCATAMVRAEALDRVVGARVAAALAQAAVDRARRTMGQHRRARVDEAAAELALLAAERRTLVQAQQRLDQAFDAGALDPRLYSRRSAELQARIVGLTERARAARARAAGLTGAAPAPGCGR